MAATPDIIDHEIIGEDLQGVVITLDPGEAVVAEAGAMMFMDDGVDMATQLSMSEGKGLFGKLFEAGKRAVMGESFFITYFANNAHDRRKVAFAAPYPGRVLPVELGDYQGTLIAQKDCFLCGARGVTVDIAFQKRIGVGLFGGEGFIMQAHCQPGRTRAGLPARGRHADPARPQARRASEGRHRLHRRVHTGCGLRHPDCPRHQEQALRWRRTLLRGADRPRHGVAPDDAVLAPLRPDFRRGSQPRRERPR